MDTRFWGPCGWNLLHNLAFAYPDNPNKKNKEDYSSFLETLPYVLPCIYCRRSLTEYYKELPITSDVLSNKKNLCYWLYQIHNKVNDKLRNQKLINYSNPSFKIICQYYKNKKQCNINSCWNFLYSIAMNYPLQQSQISIGLKYFYYQFFYYFMHLFPNIKVKERTLRYNSIFHLNDFLSNRVTLLKWVYGIEKIIDNKCMCYISRMNNTRQYISGCKGYNDIKPTCRINKKILPT